MDFLMHFDIKSREMQKGLEGIWLCKNYNLQ